MGIPKLTSDLQQLTEQTILGRSKANKTICVQNLVVDGPSLVYYVFHRLLAFKTAKGFGPLDNAPNYSEISEGIKRLLGDLESHGVVM
jgi:hypothetical protein